jgi:hypothetical protein
MGYGYEVVGYCWGLPNEDESVGADSNLHRSNNVLIP